MAHEISVDVIELDPAVYHAAKTYLGFGRRHAPRRVDLVDAAVRVAELATERRRPKLDSMSSSFELYDYAIHDCFTGGSVPHEMFDVGFWNDLKAVMKPDGVVAVVSRSPLTLPAPTSPPLFQRSSSNIL